MRDATSQGLLILNIKSNRVHICGDDNEDNDAVTTMTVMVTLITVVTMTMMVMKRLRMRIATTMTARLL